MELLPGLNFLPLSFEATWWTIFLWVGKILAFIHIPSVLLERGTRPTAALAWILCLLSLPYIGVILWWGMGRNHMKRRKRKRIHSRAQLAKSFASLLRQINIPKKPWIENSNITAIDVLHAQALYLHDTFGVFPTTQNNQVDIYFNATEAYDAFEQQIQSARHHIHLQFYIWQRDSTGQRFRDLLIKKAREGVEVRILYDAVGSSPESRKFMDELIDAGGRIAPFMPVRLFERRLRINFRNHRKIIIIDSQYAFTGGINIGNEYTKWMDLAFRFQGPVIYQLQEVFAEDWFFATNEDLASKVYFQPISVREHPNKLSSALIDEENSQHSHQKVTARIVASGPDDTVNTIHKMFFLALTSAKERIFIITPYFVPDQAIITALQTAAMRGVDVRLLVPAKSDIRLTQIAGRGYYEELLDAGVRIFEYTKSILHAKILIFDHSWSFVGSANMDIRSFRFNFEANCVLDSRSLNKELTRLFFDSQKDSIEITMDDFQQRSKFTRLIEGTARLFSPLL